MAGGADSYPGMNSRRPAGGAARRWKLRERERRFDLAVPPLLRFVLARLGTGRWRLVVTGHHLLTDGWSMPVLGRELLALYRDGGTAAALPAGDAVPGVPGVAGPARTPTKAAAAWAQALAGLEEPIAVLAPGTDRATGGGPAAEPGYRASGRAVGRAGDGTPAGGR